MISVVIPSYKRPAIILGVLMGVFQQSLWDNESGEIIVSLDAKDKSISEYKKYIRQFQLIAKDRVVCRVLINKTEGLVLAKDNAVKEAKGEYVMMMDDDLYMEKEYLQTLKSDLDCNLDVVAVSGFIVSSLPAISHTQKSIVLETIPSSKYLQKLNIEKNLNSWRALFGEKEQVMDWTYIRSKLVTEQRYYMDYFVNSYMFRKENYYKIGGYNLLLNSQTSAHEEVDFTYRLGKTGFLLFNPFVKMWHITVGCGGIYKGKDWEESKEILEKEYSESLEIFINSIQKSQKC